QSVCSEAMNKINTMTANATKNRTADGPIAAGSALAIIGANQSSNAAKQIQNEPNTPKTVFVKVLPLTNSRTATIICIIPPKISATSKTTGMPAPLKRPALTAPSMNDVVANANTAHGPGLLNL